MLEAKEQLLIECRKKALSLLPDVHKAITEFMSDLGNSDFTRPLRQGNVPMQAMGVIDSNDPEKARDFINSIK